MKIFFEIFILIIAYPFIMFGGIGLHYYLKSTDISLAWSTAIPVLLAVVLIVILEKLYPFHRPWQPVKNDIKEDFLFLTVIQVAFPKLILYFAFLMFVESDVLTTEFRNNAWPHHWHYLYQALLMIIIVDFMIYWVHRLEHQLPWLWRFHAVHHSPHKLYWLNVGRDHPVEKFLLFSFGLLPFYILDVNAQTFALYFIIFDIHAFMQHSNINIRYGFFNYLISTSELHRWHHSREIELSEHNYGNTLSIWDVLFKTWYFPYANYYDIGLRNKNYPLDFVTLMKTPFVKNIAKEDIPLPSYKELILRLFKKRTQGNTG